VHILVQFSDAGLFDGSNVDELARIDSAASAQGFADALADTLATVYGDGVAVVVRHATEDRVSIDGDTGHPEVVWVQQIAEEMWADWDWIVLAQPKIGA